MTKKLLNPKPKTCITINPRKASVTVQAVRTTFAGGVNPFGTPPPPLPIISEAKYKAAIDELAILKGKITALNFEVTTLKASIRKIHLAARGECAKHKMEAA